MKLEEFIKTHIESVDDLRSLLLFHGAPQAQMDANEVAGKLYLPPITAEKILARLAAKGLLAGIAESRRYRYQPDSAESARLIAELVELDQIRPVSLINMIYPPMKGIQAFADAFKIKKDKDEDK